MNQATRGASVASFLSSVLAALGLSGIVVACGSDSSESDDSSAAGSPTGGTMTSGSSGGTTGGAMTAASNAANTSGSTSDGSTSGGSTTGGGELPDEMCMGIGNDDPCSTPGTCSNRVCGLADTGSRDCTCTDVWSCSPCAWEDPIPEVAQQPEGELPACDASIADEVPCETVGDRCTSGDEVCACWLQKSEVYVWDCDRAPSFWE